MILNNTTNSLVDAYYIFYLEWYSRINNKKLKKKRKLTVFQQSLYCNAAMGTLGYVQVPVLALQKNRGYFVCACGG